MWFYVGIGGRGWEGGGWGGTGKGTSKSMCTRLSKLPFSKLPSLVSPQHVFVRDSETYIEKLLRNYLLGKSHFSYMKECFRNSFRNSLWLGCSSSRMSGG